MTPSEYLTLRMQAYTTLAASAAAVRTQDLSPDFDPADLKGRCIQFASEMIEDWEQEVCFFVAEAHGLLDPDGELDDHHLDRLRKEPAYLFEQLSNLDRCTSTSRPIGGMELDLSDE